MELVSVITKSLRHFEFHSMKLFDLSEIAERRACSFTTKDGRKFQWVSNRNDFSSCNHVIFWGPLPLWFDNECLLKIRAMQNEWTHVYD